MVSGFSTWQLDRDVRHRFRRELKFRRPEDVDIKLNGNCSAKIINEAERVKI